MKAYIASRFANREEVKRLSSEVFIGIGLNCIQTWPNEHEGCTPLEAAERDIREMDSADMLILYTEGCPSVPGGMHFEAGYAHGKGKYVVVIGPPVHVFCQLFEQFATPEEFRRSWVEREAHSLL